MSVDATKNSDYNESLFKIPAELRREEYKFCKIKGKGPFESNWQKNGYDFDDMELKGHITNGGNYGVIAKKGILSFVDCDSKDIAQYCDKYLPETFTVQSGGASYKRHFYYKITGEGENKQFQIDEDSGKLDLQYNDKAVVGPGSIHPVSEKEYKVIRDKSIATINYKKLIKILSKFYDRDRLDPTNMIDFSKLTARGNSEYFGKHPVHGSEGGKNFHINRRTGVWYCHRHNTGGTKQKLLAVLKGYIKCEEANEPLTIDIKEKLGLIDDTNDPDENTLKILKNRKLFYMILQEYNKQHVGDKYEMGCTFLSCISSRLEPKDRLSVAIRGDASVGKTHMVKTVLKPIPPDWYLFATRMTGPALESMAHTFDLIIQLEKLNDSKANEAIKQLSEDGHRLVKMTKNKDGNWVQTDSGYISRKAVIDTSTQSERDSEVQSRSLLVHLKSTKDKLHASQKMLLEEASSYAFGNTKKEDELHKHNWITDVLLSLKQFDKIVIPYAKRIPIEIDIPRKMRDLKRFLNLIKSITWLYQYQREQYKKNGVRYLISDEIDFEIAAIISDYAFTKSVSNKSYEVERMLKILKGDKCIKQSIEGDMDNHDDWVQRSHLQEEMGYKSRDPLKKIIEDAGGYVEVWRKSKYSPNVYIRNAEIETNSYKSTLLSGKKLLENGA